jgi:hypothetical protein
MSDDRLTLAAVAGELSRLGVTIASQPGEYRVNWRGGKEATAYYTDDLADALATGRGMAGRVPPPPPPPLGPTGRRNTRRGMILKHNRKIAARRIAQAARESRRVKE